MSVKGFSESANVVANGKKALRKRNKTKYRYCLEHDICRFHGQHVGRNTRPITRATPRTPHKINTGWFAQA
jgi:hypothetical protein